MKRSVNQQIADGFVTHTVNLLRVAADERKAVLSALESLEGELVAKLQNKTLTPFQMARTTALLKQTNETIQSAYEGIGKNNAKSLEKVAQMEAQKTVNVINNAIRVPVASVGLTKDQLGSIAGEVMINGRFPAEHWQDQSDDLKRRFTGVVRMGMLQGKGIDEIVRQVRGTEAAGYKDGIMNVSKAQATALVRTSVITTANEARIRTILENQDVAGKIAWVATLDGKTSTICRALDGLQWSLPDFAPISHDKAFPGPTAHWNCRSTQVPVTKSWAELAGPKSKLKNIPTAADLQAGMEKKLRQSGMSAEDAKKVVIDSRASMDGQVAKMDFGQWLEGKSTAFQDKLVGQGRAALFRDGKLSIRDFTDQDNRPLSLAELHALVAKNVDISPAVDGQAGITLAQRSLLSESLKHGLETGGVKTHFVSETGEHFTILGMAPTTEQVKEMKAFGKLTALRNSATDGEVWGAEEFRLFGALENFVQASIVSPDGRVFSVQVKGGKTFTQSDAQKILDEYRKQKSKAISQKKFAEVVAKNGNLKSQLSESGEVTIPASFYSATFSG